MIQKTLTGKNIEINNPSKKEERKPTDRQVQFWEIDYCNKCGKEVWVEEHKQNKGLCKECFE